jgi:hypothetical protein
MKNSNTFDSSQITANYADYTEFITLKKKLAAREKYRK